MMGKTYKEPKPIFSLLLFLFAHHVTPGHLSSDFNWTVCTSRDRQGCLCSSDFIVRCHMTNLSYLEHLIESPEVVERLNLSNNKIQRLPRGSFISFTNLTYLSLASNNIQTIGEGAFNGLTKLLEIDLSDNNITAWNTSGIKRYLPHLRFLNVEKNPFWIPDHRILSLQNLQGVAFLFINVHFTPYNLRCYLVKNSESLNQNKSEPFDKTTMAMPENTTLIKTKNPNEQLRVLTPSTCFTPKLVFRDSSFLDVVGNLSFGFRCEMISGYIDPTVRKKIAYITKGSTFYILMVETCWHLVSLVHILTSIVGILSLLSNIAVIITTLRSRVLRESVAHVLVANIALGDLLMSFYLIILVSTRQSMTKKEFDAFFKSYFCRIVGLLFLLGQISSSLLSFVMTLERYLAVVYCMRPHIRITMATCRVATSGMIFLSVLFTLFSLQTAGNFTDPDLSILCVIQDGWGCNCSSDSRHTAAKCNVAILPHIDSYINDPQFVQRLDLSNNNITDVFSGAFSNFTGLIYLSLSSSRIAAIRNEAFRGLTRLQELDLSHNNIQYWDTSFLARNLPNLIILNVAQNKHWMPDERALSVRSLEVVHVILSEIPFIKNMFLNCSLVKDASHANEDANVMNPRYALPGLYLCITPKVVIRNTSFGEIAGRFGYSLRCNVLVKTTPVFVVTSREKMDKDNAWYEVFLDSPCWKTVNSVHILTLVIGILAMFLNLAVTGTTLRSRVLRESVAHVLVANIAVGDLLAAFYMVVIIITRQSMPSAVYHYASLLPYYCRTIGLCFLVGQFSSIMMSFVMTLERYLAVVYCMRPHIRITMPTCRVAVVIVWCLSVSAAVSFMFSPKFSARVDDICIPGENSDDLNIVALVSLIGILLYASSIALYCHIYIDVKKTSERTELLERECRLARRIAMVVFTNIILFILPLIATSIVSVSPLNKRIPQNNKEIFYKTFAVTCLGINCCFNPILFSFRNEKFRFEFSKLYFQRPNSVAPDT
ncbi:uncharacterized protein LOC116298871 [Actinia tenebrosa]|uniref:Uncharacterized protein LOC116298871 n=1 Tax=Actinia tenebrosa TaxID=6105 RepID=A0A6P8I7R3_ACTTE|nr:uncharacterized protein LOC116298871 [Actinia tenebrosa]